MARSNAHSNSYMANGMPSALYGDLGGAGATQRACCTELNSLYRKPLIKISPLADSSAETTKVHTYATEQMVQGLEGPLVTPSWRLCEILGGSPQLVHIGLVRGVFICKPLAYLD
jgi:hypothetical protein